MLSDLTPQLAEAERILVFGGPYSNLQATRAMRAEADRLGIDPANVICTGDVVAYCADPAETIAEIRDWGVHVVAGNCEQQLAADADNRACGFDEGSACDVLAKGWYAYADARVGHADRVWMAELPDEAWFSWGERRFRVIHGACGATNRFVFPSEHEVIASELAGCGADVVIGGHSGIPFGHAVDDRLWINAGVIGQPANDGSRDGWYGVLGRDADRITCRLHRLAYDADAAWDAILEAGYADPYGKTLGSGIWPNNDILPDTEKAETGIALEEVSFTLAAKRMSLEQAG